MKGKTKKHLFFIIITLFSLFVFLSCSRELTNQTPLYAVANTIRFAQNDDFSQFKSMFAEVSGENASNELLLALKNSSTDTQSHDTCHFVTMSNGDVWMFQFAPGKDDASWYIASITVLSEEQAEIIKPLLEGR